MRRDKRDYSLYTLLLQTLLCCEDSSSCPDVEALCRQNYRLLQRYEYQKYDLEELRLLINEALQAIKFHQESVATVCLKRTQDLMTWGQKPEEGRIRMGLFNKVKSAITDREKKSQNAMLQKEEEEAEKKIFLLQKNIALLYDKHTETMKQLEAKAVRCAQLSPGSDEYKKTRQEALVIVPQLSAIDNQLSLYSHMLNDSARYKAMMQTGKTTFELKQFMPDLNRAETMMSWITDETRSLSLDLEDFGIGIDEHEKAIHSNSAINEPLEDTMFDKMIKDNYPEDSKEEDTFTDIKNECGDKNAFVYEKKAVSIPDAQTEIEEKSKKTKEGELA